MMNRLFQAVLVMVLAVSLSACGRRGPLEAPSAAANPTAAESAPSSQAEDKPFILDGLIQ